MSQQQPQTIAAQFERNAYPSGTWASYCRPHDADLRAAGGKITASSNDDAGNGGWSFSPTDQWVFPDGSQLVVGYSQCEAE